MPFRRSATARRRMITLATVRARAISKSRARTRRRPAQSRATRSSTSAIASGSSETSVKKTQSTTYCAADGPVSEMLFNASGMKAPGFARTAPAPTTAIAGEEATLLIRATIASTLAGSSCLFLVLTTYTIRRQAATTSMIATDVLGAEAEPQDAASPMTNAAATPTASVAPSAPM
jgi:hypothetical protein